MTTTHKDPGTSSFAKHINTLGSAVAELKVSMRDIHDDPERVVQLFEDANQSLRICNHHILTLPEQERPKHRVKIEGFQRYLTQIRPDVQLVSRRALLDGRDDPTAAAPAFDGTSESVEQLQANTSASLMRSLALTHESATMGEATSAQLMQQREQLEKAHKEVKRIDQMMDQSEYLIRGIKSIGGAISNVFRKVPVVDPLSSSSGSSGATPRASGTTPRAAAGTAVPATSMSTRDTSDGVLVRQSTDADRNRAALLGTSAGGRGASNGTSSSRDSSNPFGAEESGGGQQQMQLRKDDQLLDQISQNLSYLKVLGTEIGNEIESQNTLISALGTDVDKVNSRVEKNNRDIKKILK